MRAPNLGLGKQPLGLATGINNTYNRQKVERTQVSTNSY